MLMRVLILVLLLESVVSYENLYELTLSLRAENLLHRLKDFNSTQCAEDARTLISDLKNGEMYALQMLDSWAKFPDGLLIGNHYFLGQFEECHDVVAPSKSYAGKYCLLGMDIPEWNLTSLYAGLSPFSYAVCVPSSCSVEELNEAFSTLNETVILLAEELSCSSYEDTVELEVGDGFVLGLIGLLVMLAILSTSYEVWQLFHVNNDKPHPLLTSFSLYRNGRAIFEVKKIPGQIECLNGLRALSMCWVVLCHDASSIMYGPTYNVLYATQDIQKPLYVGITNGFHSVDTFFLLSGLLVSFVFLRDVGKTGRYDVPRSYISRFLRLTPTYAMTILLNITILKYMGDGPIWNSYLYELQESCRNSWWTGLLYVNNYFNSDDQVCLIQTWYLSADMQLYWLSPLLLYPIMFWPKLGAIFVAVVTVAAAFMTFGIALANDLPYSPLFDQTLDGLPFWTRSTPWLTGICLGYIISGIKAGKIKMKLSKMWIMLGWLVSLSVCCACLFGAIWFLENPNHTSAQAAAFLAFARLGWAVGVGWIIFACIFGYGGPINAFLSYGLFQPLAKLSYSAYLIHVSVIYMMIGCSRVLMYENLTSLTFSFIATVMVANLAAIPLALLVELPSSALERYFFRDVKILPYPRLKTKSKHPLNSSTKAEP